MRKINDRIRELAEWLLAHDDIAITSHVAPDGDALGSALGIAHALGQLGKRCFVTLQDEVPDRYRFLPGSDAVFKPDRPPFAPKHLLVLDCAAADRIGSAAMLLEVVEEFASLDHHVTSAPWGAVSVIEPAAAATGELCAMLSGALGAPLTVESATCFYAAIIDDTGNFNFPSTTPNTFRVAANCVERGVDVAGISYRLFRARSQVCTKLLGMALAGIEYRADGQLALIRVTGDMKAELGATSDDVEKIVNFGVDTIGVEVSMMVEEIEQGARVSLRSKERVDVAEIALALGGGGHARAAGATVYLPLDQVVDIALKAIEGALGAPQR